MTGGIEAGDLSALREANLAQAGEFVALAALARRQETSVTALSALAGRGDDGEAFRWVWSLVLEAGESPQRLQVVLGALPAPVTIPVDLEDSLEHFLLRDVPGRGSSPWEALLAGLLGHLDPAADVTERVARSYVATRTGERREAGLDALAAREHEASRAVVLDHAESLSYHLAPAALERLRPPYTDTEVQRLLQLLGELRQRAADPSGWASAATVAARLPTPALAELLSGEWNSGYRDQLVRDGRLLAKLGGEGALHLLQGLDDAVATHVLAHAAQLSGADFDALAVWAHSRFLGATAGALRKPLIQEHGQEREWERSGLLQNRLERHDALAVLWECVLVTDEQMAVFEVAVALAPAELSDRFPADVDARGAQRLGWIAAELIRRDPELFLADVLRRGEDLPDGLAADYFAGFAEAQGAHDLLPEAVLDQIVRFEAALVMALGHLSPDLLLAAATADPAISARMLLLGHEMLTSEQARALMAALPWDELPPGVDYNQLVQALSDHPGALAVTLAQVLDSLTGPEATAAPREVLRAAVSTAAQYLPVEELGRVLTPEHLDRLLDVPDVVLTEAVCDLTRRADIHGATPDEARAELVSVKDDAFGAALEPLHRLRSDLAARFADVARDLHLTSEQRMMALARAEQLTPATARRAALELAASPDSGVQLAAAGTLARTPGQGEDLARLVELRDGARVVAVRKLLDQAVHRLSSGDLGEALRNLAELVGIDPDDFDAAILVPQPNREEMVRAAIDQTRAQAESGAPSSFINEANILSDALVDLAIIAHHDADPNDKQFPVRGQRLELIRSNGARREDTGALLNMQSLLQHFPWFHTCATLRSMRRAHPSPVNTTEPLVLNSEDLITARSLLRTVVDGWVASMHAAAALQRTAAPPATETRPGS